MKSGDLKYLIALHRALNLTFTRFKKLQKVFENEWREMFRADPKTLREADLDPRGIENFLANRDNIDPDHEIELLERCGANVLVYGTDTFPSQLENIYNPPVMLFVRGEILSTDFPSISVVGARRLSAYGRRAIEKIIGEIADNRITIVSGLAFGADTCAHSTALKHGARTIAVLGNGIDTIYPQQNHDFAEKFLANEQGAVLSEYLPGTEVRPEYFPVRNRIISGLSKAVIVIEAAEKSGSLITAEIAVEQGREIFAVPGEIFSKNSAGTNQIITSGQAHPALSGKQILDALGFKNLAAKKAAQESIPKTGIEAEILKLFNNDENKLHINDLMRASRFPGPVVSSNIAILEIKGLVKNIGNQTYVKNF